MPVNARPDLQAVRQLGVRRLAIDSRMVRPGDTFVAYPGEARDGRDYIPQAIANGAASVLWDADQYAWNARWRTPNLGIPQLRRHAGVIASEIYGNPGAQLWSIGVTGTNGKTSCSQWIAQSLTRVRRKCAVIGTLGSGFPGRLDAQINTTPDAVSMHARLRSMKRAGARAVCMEVSSHGLAQDRLSGVKFDVALLTNLSRDHLDFHRTMRRYKAAKARLFRWPTLSHAVLNLDDAFGRELAERWQRQRAQTLGYGFQVRTSRSPQPKIPCVVGRNLRLGLDGMSFDITSPWGKATLQSPMIGSFNAANLLGSLAVLLASDVGLDRAVAALEKVVPVPGRTERYGGGRAPLVIVDYAHTPDALEKVLQSLRAAAGAQSRLYCVFGCGGDRDRGKRPLMGALAARLADRVIITSDNPRHEDPQSIIDDIAAGVAGAHEQIPDRRQAINRALTEAAPGDIVLIAGKGHERYQEIRGVRRRYSDAAVVRTVLARGKR